MESKFKKRGFGSMSEEKKKMIASMGGKKAHELGKRHKFSHAEAVDAGRIGGKSLKRRKR